MKLDRAAPPLCEIWQRLRYDQETGRFYMLISAGRRKIGDLAGYADSNGYWKISINGKWVMAHRLAWAFVYGEWPKGEIDHINGDPSDNRIINLRVATRSQNMMNTRRGNGVCWHKGIKKWQVYIKAGGRGHYFGKFEDRQEAERVAVAAKMRLHGDFANIAQPEQKPVQEPLL